jgi:hypothetical protein
MNNITIMSHLRRYGIILHQSFSTLISHLWCFHFYYGERSPIRGDIMVEKTKTQLSKPHSGRYFGDS